MQRGWNAITFDGPGQGAALHRQGLYFRHDWETVITAVVEFLLARDDVDGKKIALQGISQAGYWAPRAAAFEHRLAALVADPGVMSVVSSWERHLPPEMVAMLDQGNREDFDALMGADPDPNRRAMLAWRMAPYGLTSLFDTYIAARKMTLDDQTVAQIECPTLVLDPDHEQFWPGQSQALYDALTCRKELARFTVAEGADWHCEPAAQSLREPACVRLSRRRHGLNAHADCFALLVFDVVHRLGRRRRGSAVVAVKDFRHDPEKRRWGLMRSRPSPATAARGLLPPGPWRSIAARA